MSKLDPMWHVVLMYWGVAAFFGLVFILAHIGRWLGILKF